MIHVLPINLTKQGFTYYKLKLKYYINLYSYFKDHAMVLYLFAIVRIAKFLVRQNSLG